VILKWIRRLHPQGGLTPKPRQCAALYRLAHEETIKSKAAAPALGKLLDALVRFVESLRTILTTQV